MIVKNEENVLARCLDSLRGLTDEIIIVDTGSTDDTKEIARRYTDLVYDFSWCEDFAAARNFSFSKATMEYIYSADADEFLDEVNRKRFSMLKSAMLPEIEIVQMQYVTPAKYNTVQNASRELRPKLFRRLRTFTWINPVHETVRLDPVVYDSDIEIQHLPQELHGKRDFSIFRHSFAKNGSLPQSITTMYAKELLKCGTPEDIADAAPIFEGMYRTAPSEESICVLARYYRQIEDNDHFFSVALKNVAHNGYSEVCCELGTYYFEHGDYEEAALWFYNAAFDAHPVLDIETGGCIPLGALADCYERWADSKEAALDALPPAARFKLSGDTETIHELRQKAEDYRRQAREWTLPSELD
jgi:glycosyltransferase involved in cell wall biosynthesis